MDREVRPGSKLAASAALVAVGIVALTFFPWFGPKLSGIPNGGGFVAFPPVAAKTLTAWEASTPFALALVLMSLTIIATVMLTGSRLDGLYGFAIMTIGLFQVAAILLFDLVGVSRPFPTETEIIDGDRVTLSFGLLSAGYIALILAAVLAAFGAVSIYLRYRYRAASEVDGYQPQLIARGG